MEADIEQWAFQRRGATATFASILHRQELSTSNPRSSVQLAQMAEMARKEWDGLIRSYTRRYGDDKAVMV